MPKKSDTQLRREIELYWPGGTGGGGSRRGQSNFGAVVKPHTRTSPQCKRCSQYHTTEEHDRHAHGSKVKPKPKVARAKATKARPKKTKEVTKKTNAKSTKSHVTNGPLSEPQKVDIVLQAVRSARSHNRHSGGVYVSSVWEKVGRKLGMTLEEFKRWLVKMNAQQMLTLVRVDLADTADPGKLEESYISDMGAIFDIIADPYRQDRGRGYF